MSYRYIPPALRAKAQNQSQDNPTRSTSSHNNSSSMPSYPVTSNLRGGDRPRHPSSNNSNKSYDNRSGAPPDEELHSLDEIENHFWPRTSENAQMNSATSKTLHDSAKTPGQLAYVLLFKDANPKWKDKGVIFTKSSLELLPAGIAENSEDTAEGGSNLEAKDNSSQAPTISDKGNTAEEQPAHSDLTTNPDPDTPTPLPSSKINPHPPIAIFTQHHRSPPSTRSFSFTGYFQIMQIQYLLPHSKALQEMLEQKWTLTDRRTGVAKYKQRDAERWNESLGFRWAVVKFVRVERGDDGGDMNAPKIQRIEEVQKKSVNELLREMRLGAGASERGEGKVGDNMEQEGMGRGGHLT